MNTERDLAFASDFMKNPLPKEKRWMSKYFKTRTKKLFLKYYAIFESATRFRQHCGETCTNRYVKKMKRQYINLAEKHKKAKNEFDLECLERIEKGKFKLT